MPPKPKGRKPKAAAAEAPLTGPVCVGGGITAGLELWWDGRRFVLVDTTADKRFADDVTAWQGLNASSTKVYKDAA